MFPSSVSGTAHHWLQDPQLWVGVVRYTYPDLQVREEEVDMEESPDWPVLFTTEEEAIRAAESQGRLHMISERTERLEGVYGGDS